MTGPQPRKGYVVLSPVLTKSSPSGMKNKKREERGKEYIALGEYQNDPSFKKISCYEPVMKSTKYRSKFFFSSIHIYPPYSQRRQEKSAKKNLVTE